MLSLPFAVTTPWADINTAVSPAPKCKVCLSLQHCGHAGAAESAMRPQARCVCLGVDG